MDAKWLTQLRYDSVVLVPTRSLANCLHEQVAAKYLQDGKQVWESPNILLWRDYLTHIWQLNRQTLYQATGATNFISDQQALLLWTQVIEASRRSESALTLLDVRQTARAVQGAWRLLHDWQLGEDTLRHDHAADTQQFLAWLADYRAKMHQRNLLDAVLLQEHLLVLPLELPFKRMYWHCYDLITAAQQAHQNQVEERGVESLINTELASNTTHLDYHSYADEEDELRAALQQAREALEADAGLQINIVVPDLAQCHDQLGELARDVFYPALSPLEVSQQTCVYRFSLGQSLQEWPAVEAALSVVKLLRNRCTVTEMSFLLRNRFLAISHQHRSACSGFDLWLQRQRLRFVLVDQLPELFLQYQQHTEPPDQSSGLLSVFTGLVAQRHALAKELQERKAEHDYAALSFTEWVECFTNWLEAWGWNTEIGEQTMDSVQYQLLVRWQKLLEEFKSLATVQRQVGLSRAMDLLEQMARDTPFLPKAVASPIFISGVYEAIGRPADICMLTGMSERYPRAPQADAFIPNRLLVKQGFPDAGPNTALAQAQQVLHSLLRYSKQTYISYAKHSVDHQEIALQPSPLFRHENFIAKAKMMPPQTSIELYSYVDTHGPAWPDVQRASGGSQIFVNQSQCAFKAFATHQLGCQTEDEAEFGLDARERGSIVHRMLQMAWQELGSQSALLAFSEQDLLSFAERIAGAATKDPGFQLSVDKQRLLQREKPRLTALLLAWLAVEIRRPIGFDVVEVEQEYRGEIAGISFRFKIDRLDLCKDGSAVLVDYKTGSAYRKDWLGPRLKQPQLPLYALQLDAQKQSPLAGIAYAQVLQPKPQYVALAESGVISRGTAVGEREWHESRARWPETFNQLAEDFKRGDAQVYPIDDEVCGYCEFKPMCRVAQLKQLALEADDAE